MTTTRARAVARALHRAGYHDLAEDVEDGDVSPAAAERILRRTDDAAAIAAADQIAAIPADPLEPEPAPPAGGAEPEPEQSGPDPSEPEPGQAADPGDDAPEAEPNRDVPAPNPPKPKGPEPEDGHWYVRRIGRRRESETSA